MPMRLIKNPLLLFLLSCSDHSSSPRRQHGFLLREPEVSRLRRFPYSFNVRGWGKLPKLGLKDRCAKPLIICIITLSYLFEGGFCHRVGIYPYLKVGDGFSCTI
ncbi:hypothetical protein BJX61DRAFT_471837 [Aspergillus egyptiacus]|nr:hypothetical protein BJX61DRAFT_471837 [Aspergillus egyptiacus]